MSMTQVLLRAKAVLRFLGSSRFLAALAIVLGAVAHGAGWYGGCASAGMSAPC